MTVLTKAVLDELLSYDEETGFLFWKLRPKEMFSSERLWKRWNTRYGGTRALASVSQDGYSVGCLLGKHCKAHIAIWIIQYGGNPEQVDHINGVKADNRIVNLRSVSHRENMKNKSLQTNNKSGIMGVFWHQLRERWVATIGRKTIGYYKTFEEAARSRRDAEISLNYHENHGRAA